MVRLFKHGEAVQLKRGGTRMKVLNYVTVKRHINETVVPFVAVLCSWTDEELRPRKGIFNQWDLMRAGSGVSGNEYNLPEQARRERSLQPMKGL